MDAESSGVLAVNDAHGSNVHVTYHAATEKLNSKSPLYWIVFLISISERNP